jgi:hypothetical protein
MNEGHRLSPESSRNSDWRPWESTRCFRSCRCPVGGSERQDGLSAARLGPVLLTYVETGGFSHVTMITAMVVTLHGPLRRLAPACPVPPRLRGLLLPNPRVKKKPARSGRPDVCRPATAYVGPPARMQGGLYFRLSSFARSCRNRSRACFPACSAAASDWYPPAPSFTPSVCYVAEAPIATDAGAFPCQRFQCSNPASLPCANKTDR